MLRKIVDSAYSYNGEGAVTFACTVQFIAPDGQTVIESMSAACTRNLNVAGWKGEIAAEIKAKADEYELALLNVLSRAQEEFPAAQTPDRIIAAMAGYVEEVCNGVG